MLGACGAGHDLHAACLKDLQGEKNDMQVNGGLERAYDQGLVGLVRGSL